VSHNLDGKIALVTGASRGIGAATARLLASSGAHVAINYARSADRAEKVLAEIRAAGGTAELFPADIADPRAIQALVQDVVKRFGQIDIVVNNAGAAEPTPLGSIDCQAMHAMLDINLIGPILVIQNALPHFPKRGGSIVNVTSTAAITPGPGYAAYAASKAGLAAVTQTFAKDLAARDIRVNAVAPGPIATDALAAAPEETQAALKARSLFNRIGEAGEVANVIAFLASDDSSWITGRQVIVDGGRI
jgi:3-oxoacyl-[acyl-carrier protein] reductase